MSSLSFSFALKVFLQLFEVLYCALSYETLLLLMGCFFFVFFIFILDCLSEKEIHWHLPRWFSFQASSVETAALTFTFLFVCVFPLLSCRHQFRPLT